MSYAVNLLPQHLRPQTGVNAGQVLVLALLGVPLICGLLFGYQKIRECRVEGKLSETANELQMLLPQREQVRKAKTVRAAIQMRTAILSRIDKEQAVKWSGIIRELGQVTPDNLWLAELSGDAAGNVVIRGGASGIENVSRYVDNLRKIPAIDNVSFIGLVMEDVNERAGGAGGGKAPSTDINIIKYELNVRLKGVRPHEAIQ